MCSDKKISVVINTYNAEQYLARVLESVKRFDEIVVCDMYSTDQTIFIAEKYGCKVVYHKKINYVEPARNFAVQQASNQWVLVVDADEFISDELRTYLYQYIESTNCCDGLYITRKNYFMGRWMRSAYPDFNLRFFKKELIHWTSNIHMQPQINGKVEKIPKHNQKLAIEHLSFDSLEMLLAKQNIYTSAEITKRKGQKVNALVLIFNPIITFIKFFFLKRAFLDGLPGFIFSIYKMQYKFNTLSKIIESRQFANNNQ